MGSEQRKTRQHPVVCWTLCRLRAVFFATKIQLKLTNKQKFNFNTC
nr:MAG TPA: hypothetical protein [Caudoviricetes sp.]